MAGHVFILCRSRSSYLCAEIRVRERKHVLPLVTTQILTAGRSKVFPQLVTRERDRVMCHSPCSTWQDGDSRILGSEMHSSGEMTPRPHRSMERSRSHPHREKRSAGHYHRSGKEEKRGFCVRFCAALCMLLAVAATVVVAFMVASAYKSGDLTFEPIIFKTLGSTGEVSQHCHCSEFFRF